MEMVLFEVLLSARELLLPSMNKASPPSPAKEQRPGSWPGKQARSFCSFSMRMQCQENNSPWNNKVLA